MAGKKIVRKLLRVDNSYLKAFVLFSLLVMGAFFRLYQLGRDSLWWDEIQTIIRVKESYWTMLRLAYLSTIDPHLLLYDSLVHGMLYFGRSDFIVRLPSAVFGILAIILIFKVGKLLFDSDVGMISAFLLSISAVHIAYSQELRAYSLLVFLSLLSLLFFYQALFNNKKKYWIGYILSTALCLYTHYFAFFILLIEIAFVACLLGDYFLKKRKKVEITPKVIAPFLISLAIIFLLYLPWLPAFVKHALVRSHGPGKGVTLENLSVVLRELTVWRYIDSFPYKELLPGLFLLGLLISLKRQRRESLLILLWIGLPFLILFLIRYSVRICTRHVLFILPIFLITVSAGIMGIVDSLIVARSKIGRFLRRGPDFLSQKESLKTVLALLLTIVVFFPLMVASIPSWYSHQRSGYKEAAQYLEAHLEEGEIIASRDQNSWNAVGWYLDPGLTNTLPHSPPSGYIRMWWIGPSYMPLYEEDVKPRAMKNGLKPMFKNQDVALFKGIIMRTSPILILPPVGERRWSYDADYRNLSRVYADYYSAHNMAHDAGYSGLYPFRFDEPGEVVYKFVTVEGRKIEQMTILPSFFLYVSKTYAKVYVSTDGADFTLVRAYEHDPEYPRKLNDYFLDLSQMVRGSSEVYVKIELFYDISASIPTTALLLNLTADVEVSDVSPLDQNGPRLILEGMKRNIPEINR